jgi:hypothetical protein
MGGGFLLFGLFWLLIGIRSSGNYGGDYLMWIGGTLSLMGAILVSLFFKNHRNEKRKVSN